MKKEIGENGFIEIKAGKTPLSKKKVIQMIKSQPNLIGIVSRAKIYKSVKKLFEEHKIRYAENVSEEELTEFILEQEKTAHSKERSV